ncbi:MAG TPA: hypothetical protein VN376_02375, partial [Longilinea sp.]|nr:hypothetical protein [Longilinea sp.]
MNTKPASLSRYAVYILLSLVFSVGFSACDTEGTAPTQTYPTTTPNPNIQVYFTAPGSEQGLSTLLVEAIDDAQYSIDVAMYNFSMDDVGDALIRAYRRGVQV